MLRLIEKTLSSQPTFEPATSTREFRVVGSDYALTLLTPYLMSMLKQQAPQVKLRLESVRPIAVDSPEELLRSVDLLLIPRGHFTGLPVKDLFRDRWVCITGADNPRADEPYTMDDVGELRWARAFAPVSATLADRQIDDIVDFGQHTDVVVDTFSMLPPAVSGYHPVRHGAGAIGPRVPVPLPVTNSRVARRVCPAGRSGLVASVPPARSGPPVVPRAGPAGGVAAGRHRPRIRWRASSLTNSPSPCRSPPMTETPVADVDLIQNRADDPAWFRYVLGQYPTGVTLITARHPDGTALGMVVGTFSSVSLDPPLVAFMPDVRSSSWPKIREAGSFCANILTSAQQDVCRAFARKEEHRFTASTWSDTETGSPRLEGAAAWVDCTIENVHRAGDHDIVIGRVTSLGVGDADGLPLLFLRGGYGSFSIPSIESLNNFLPRQVRAVDAARPDIEALTTDLNLECLVSVAVEDSVVVVSAAGVAASPHGAPSRVGISFQLAAPLAPLHVAWAGPEAERRWLGQTRSILGSVAEDAALAELARVRRCGYPFPPVPRPPRSSNGRCTSPVTRRLRISPVCCHRCWRGPAPVRPIWVEPAEVTSLHAPVFGPDGQVALSLTLNGFSGKDSSARLRECLDLLLQAAQRITDKLGGTHPVS